jgi:hypothetical protein
MRSCAWPSKCWHGALRGRYEINRKLSAALKRKKTNRLTQNAGKNELSQNKTRFNFKQVLFSGFFKINLPQAQQKAVLYFLKTNLQRA